MTISSVNLPAHHPFEGMDLSSALADRVRVRGDHPFLIWEPGPGEGTARRWTYREFESEVAEVAGGLIGRGVRPGDPVVVHLANCPAFVMMLFACARVGAVAVNSNVHSAPDEFRHVLETTRPVGVVATGEHLDAIEYLGSSVSWTVAVDDTTGCVPALQEAGRSLPTRPTDPGAPLCVQFTSGSTSRPKPVLFTHANGLWAGKVGAAHAGLQSDDIQLIYAPLFHTAGLSWQLLSTFWAGGTVVLQPKFSASRFWPVSLEHRCTRSFALGILLQTLFAQPVPEHHYRTWIFGLEMPAVEEHFRVRLCNGWGMTELVTQAIVGDPLVPVDEGAIGRPALEYEIRIVGEGGQPVPDGKVGEVWVRGVPGVSVFAGYLGLDDPFDAEGFFHTGDRMSVLPSGAVRFASRSSELLKVGGENVAAPEVERVIREVPGVAQVAVVARTDRILDEVPVAFVVATAQADLADLPAQIQATCSQRLARFKVPREVHLVDELPEALMGKIAKSELTARANELHAKAEAAE